jgi:hypothetical protein
MNDQILMDFSDFKHQYLQNKLKNEMKKMNELNERK